MSRSGLMAHAFVVIFLHPESRSDCKSVFKECTLFVTTRGLSWTLLSWKRAQEGALVHPFYPLDGMLAIATPSLSEPENSAHVTQRPGKTGGCPDQLQRLSVQRGQQILELGRAFVNCPRPTSMMRRSQPRSEADKGPGLCAAPAMYKHLPRKKPNTLELVSLQAAHVRLPTRMTGLGRKKDMYYEKMMASRTSPKPTSLSLILIVCEWNKELAICSGMAG